MIWNLFSIPFCHRNQVADEPDIKREHVWYSSEFKPKEGVDYAIVLKYAENLYNQALTTFSSLYKKAEWLYGLTIAAIAAVYLMCPDKRISVLLAWGLPSLVFSGLAFISIIRTKCPGERPASMSIRGAIQCVESPDNPSAILSANLHCATKEILKVNAWKANQITNASYALIVAFVLAPIVLAAPSPNKVTSSRAADSPPTISPSPAADSARQSAPEGELVERMVPDCGKVHGAGVSVHSGMVKPLKDPLRTKGAD
jgi:hypothetical protein